MKHLKLRPFRPVKKIFLNGREFPRQAPNTSDKATTWFVSRRPEEEGYPSVLGRVIVTRHSQHHVEAHFVGSIEWSVDQRFAVSRAKKHGHTAGTGQERKTMARVTRMRLVDLPRAEQERKMERQQRYSRPSGSSKLMEMIHQWKLENEEKGRTSKVRHEQSAVVHPPSSTSLKGAAEKVEEEDRSRLPISILTEQGRGNETPTKVLKRRRRKRAVTSNVHNAHHTDVINRRLPPITPITQTQVVDFSSHSTTSLRKARPECMTQASAGFESSSISICTTRHGSTFSRKIGRGRCMRRKTRCR